ncbi:unnamed protein product [Alopecurus aequalis]
MQRRNSETSWVLPHRPGTVWETPFSLLPVAFPREVTQVFDAILLRAASHADVSSVEVDDGDFDPISGVISVSVAHVGERIPFVPIGRQYVDLISMFDGFPASRYEIELNDGDQKLSYKQVLSPSGQSGNMVYRLPIIQQSEDTRNWTKVTFKPDFTVFNLINSDVKDIQHTVWKRLVDIAGTMGGTMGSLLKVRLRGHDLDVYDFYPGYVRSYPQFALERRRCFAPERIFGIPTCSNPDHRWEVCVSWSHGEFEHISFVNGLSTDGGGTHVELVKKVLVDYAQKVKEKCNIRIDCNNKMRRGIGYDSRFDVEDICIFINLFINKPIFHSDTKNRLANEFEEGYKLKFSSEFLNMFLHQIMQNRPLRLPDEITNLVDARQAGRTHSSKCYLILTNGDSNILSGINYHDRKFYGVLSLESNIPNAKTAGDYRVFQNKDVRNIMASLGLEKGVCYKNAKKLRYAHIMLMINQDNDGAHTKGLIINLLHTWWPSLLLQKNFLFQFVIPIIKATHHEEKHEFFSVREYNKWICTTKDYAKWTTKSYKSLGAHTVEETKEYFKNKIRYRQGFQICGLQDSNAIDLVFSKDRVNDRKDWIKKYEEGNFLDLEKESITYEDFFKKELILYFIEDKKLYIPSMIDGCKKEDIDDTKLHQTKRRRKNI